jgi:hypothetical protein
MAKKSEIPDLDRIKYWFPNNKSHVFFGDVERYSDEAEAHAKKGQIIVADPITGDRLLLFLAEIEYKKQPFSWGEYDEETRMPIDTEYDRYINDAYKKAIKKSDAAGKGMVKDKLFTIPVADGSAWYVVTKVNKKSVKIEWRGFCPDQWTDPTLGYGGSFPHNCIEQHCEWADVRKKMFT